MKIMKTREDAIFEVTKMLEACRDWFEDYEQEVITRDEIIEHIARETVLQLEYKDFNKGWIEKEQEQLGEQGVSEINSLKDALKWAYENDIMVTTRYIIKTGDDYGFAAYEFDFINSSNKMHIGFLIKDFDKIDEMIGKCLKNKDGLLSKEQE